jgi:hypothetical protein
MLLKMAFRHSLSFIIFFATLCCFSQETTVFITGEGSDTKSKSSFLDDFGIFSQFAVSLPFRANPNYTNAADNDEYWFVPDGISAHAGFGAHVFESIGFSLNTGVDWHGTPKLVSVPVYGSIMLTPSISDTSGILLQAGFGEAFAIGHGRKGGFYQKYRAGYIDEEGNFGFFAEVNFYGYSWKDAGQMGSVNLGMCFFLFED